MAKMPFSSLILRNTISTNPLARLLLIACWRCIVFLILWDMERKRSNESGQTQAYCSDGWRHVAAPGVGGRLLPVPLHFAA